MPVFRKRLYRWHFCFPIALLVAVGLAPASSFAAPCNPALISNKLPYHSDPRAPGVTTDRFLVPPGDRPVVHGVDVSKYQDLVDFEAVKSCGGSFAFIRLSAGVNVGNELL